LQAGGPIAIIGAGFSGAALAVALLERGATVLLIERGEAFGPGLAYGTRCGRHLLNVRSARMSLRPDAPDDFVRWLRDQRLPADPDGFAPRRDFGRYIRDRLGEAERRAPGRLVRVAAEAMSVAVGETGASVGLADGRTLRAAHVVLALGNPPPGALRLPGLDAAGAAYLPDPWATEALAAIGAQDEVFLIGAGLTAVDVLLALEAQGWRGRAAAVSRRGLLPRTHGPRSALEADPSPAPLPLSQRLHEVRRRARREPWTAVLDRMRPHHQALWRAASPAERLRFLRHLRPWWDVHRHRMAPEIGAAVERWLAEGRLRAGAGRLLRVERTDAGLEVVWRTRRGGEARTPASFVVNCTGPEGDPSRVGGPLLRGLLESGAARVDPLRLGLDTDAEGRIIEGNGRPQSRLSALGPLTRGALWEIVAVPEIREQAQQTAARLVGERQAPARWGLLDAFTEHPREMGETYGQHLRVAFRFGGRLLAAGAAACLHGLAPFLFKKTASREICALHAELLAARRRPPEPQ